MQPGFFIPLSKKQVCEYNPPMFPVVDNGVAEGIGDNNLTIVQNLVY